MSTEIGSVVSSDQKKLMVTCFYGGQDRGPCVQLTFVVDPSDSGWAELTMEQVDALIKLLQESKKGLNKQWRVVWSAGAVSGCEFPMAGTAEAAANMVRVQQAKEQPPKQVSIDLVELVPLKLASSEKGK